MTIIQSLNNFINSQNWIFAKTMAEIPHWYCLKSLCEDEGEWKWFVRIIEEYGVDGVFYGRIYKYLYWGDYRYWMMDPTPEECDLINRCIIPDSERNPKNFPSFLKSLY